MLCHTSRMSADGKETASQEECNASRKQAFRDYYAPNTPRRWRQKTGQSLFGSTLALYTYSDVPSDGISFKAWCVLGYNYKFNQQVWQTLQWCWEEKNFSEEMAASRGIRGQNINKRRGGKSKRYKKRNMLRWVSKPDKRWLQMLRVSLVELWLLLVSPSHGKFGDGIQKQRLVVESTFFQ